MTAGNRPSAGKGKPSKLWKLADGQPVPIVTPSPAPVTPTPAVIPPTVPTEPVIVPAAESPKLLSESTETAKVEAKPDTTPTVEIPLVVEVLKVEPTGITPSVKVKIDPVVEVKKIVEDARTLKETCPICNHPLLAINDATGIMVWCPQPSEICPSAENPFGHGKTEQEAYFKLIERWTRKSSIVSVGSNRLQS